MFNFFKQQKNKLINVFLFWFKQNIFVYLYLGFIRIIFFRYLVKVWLWVTTVISAIMFYKNVMLYFIFNGSVLDGFLLIFLTLLFNFLYSCMSLILLPVYILPELFLLIMVLLIIFLYFSLLLNFKNSLNNTIRVAVPTSFIRTLLIPKPFNLKIINLSALTLVFFIFLQLQLFYKLLQSHTILFFSVYSNFCIDPIILTVKLIVSFMGLIALVAYLNLNSVFYKFEVSIGILLTVFSSSLLLHSYTLITFFLSLEFFNFCVLILITAVSSNKQLRLNTIKYFLFNSFSSLLLLSFIIFTFGTFGTFSFKLISLICLTSFNDLAHFNIYISLTLSLVFFIVGFLLKLGAFPFHTWLFELYEDLPYFCMAYLLSLTKLTTFTFGFYFSMLIFSNCSEVFRFVFLLVGLLTLCSASLLSLLQITIRRFLIVNSVFSTGSLLVILSIPTVYSQSSFFLYLIFDSIFFFTFTLFLNFLEKKKVSQSKSIIFQSSTLSSLLDLSLIKNIYLRLTVALLLFVYAGFPPFAFFYIKLYIIEALLSNNFFLTSVIFISASFIMLFSFIRILKMMFFFTNITNKRVKYSVVTLSGKCSFGVLFIFIFILTLTFTFSTYSDFMFYVINSFLYFL